jgi:uncharacterized repeat protein (TIGR01451 family)
MNHAMPRFGSNARTPRRERLRQHVLAGLVLACLLLALAPQAAAGTTLFSYTSEQGETLPPDPDHDPLLSVDDITRGPGLTEHGQLFSSRHWSTGSTRTQAAADGSYLAWGFAAEVPVDLGELSLGFSRHPQGPQTLQIEISVDGGPWQVVYTLPDLPPNDAYLATMDLSAYTGVTTAAFRLYGWNAAGWNGWLQLENMDELGGRSMGQTGSPGKAEIDAGKTVRVISQDGTGCRQIDESTGGTAGAAIPGACVEYRIDAHNFGTAPATELRIADLLAPHFTFVAAEARGFDSSAPGFGLLTPTPGTDCAIGRCEVELKDAILPPGARGLLIIRTLLK